MDRVCWSQKEHDNRSLQQYLFYLLYREVVGFVRLNVHPVLVDHGPDLVVVDGDPGPRGAGEAVVEVVLRLDVEDDVESHDRSWEGGGPHLLVVAGHVGVEGIADSEAGTQLRHEETEE